jgi:carboxyl-terminal processing protease
LIRSPFLANHFLFSETFLLLVDTISPLSRKKSENRKWFARKGDVIKGKPLIVLINYGSASASEIVAGALKIIKELLYLGKTAMEKDLYNQ